MESIRYNHGFMGLLRKGSVADRLFVPYCYYIIIVLSFDGNQNYQWAPYYGLVCLLIGLALVVFLARFLIPRLGALLTYQVRYSLFSNVVWIH